MTSEAIHFDLVTMDQNNILEILFHLIKQIKEF